MAEGLVSELKQGHKEMASSVLTLRSHNPGKVRCHVLRRLKQTHGKVYMVRNWGALPTTSKALRLPASGRVSEQSWEYTLQS